MSITINEAMSGLRFGIIVNNLGSVLQKICCVTKKYVECVRWRQSLLATLSVENERWLIIEEDGADVVRYDLFNPTDVTDGLKHIKLIVAGDGQEEIIDGRIVMAEDAKKILNMLSEAVAETIEEITD